MGWVLRDTLLQENVRKKSTSFKVKCPGCELNLDIACFIILRKKYLTSLSLFFWLYLGNVLPGLKILAVRSKLSTCYLHQDIKIPWNLRGTYPALVSGRLHCHCRNTRTLAILSFGRGSRQLLRWPTRIPVFSCSWHSLCNPLPLINLPPTSRL